MKLTEISKELNDIISEVIFMICHNCGRYNSDDQDKCVHCGADFNKNFKNDNERQTDNGGFLNKPNKFDVPLKWYKFLVIILLPVSIFSNIIDGMELIISPKVTMVDISGLGDVSTKALEKLNTFSGICMVLIAVFMCYTWNVLRKMKKNSLMCIRTIYIANFIFNSVNGFLMYYILGSQAKLAVYGMIIINLISAVFMIIANTIYFNKRKHIFVN